MNRAMVPMLGVLLLAGCSGKKPEADPALIRLDGSSTVYPLSSAVAEAFTAKHGAQGKPTVWFSGTTAGFQKFSRNECDLTGASRPILMAESKLLRERGLEFLELPVCFDALTIAVHADNTWCSSITVSELKKLWEPAAEGKVMKWSDVRAGWPAEKIDLFGADGLSGTYDYFTYAIVGKARHQRQDYTASENDRDLVEGIATNKLALGYVPLSYYVANRSRLRAVAVEWDQGSSKGAVLPSVENVLNETYKPLSRPLFVYVNRASLHRDEVKQFVEFYLASAPELTRKVYYVPLPESAYAKVRERFQKLQVGTSFDGKPERGLKLEDVFRRAPQ